MPPTAPVTLTVTPTPALRTGWRAVLLNAVSAIAGLMLLILPYLMTLDLSTVLSPRGVLIWTVAINILTIILRAYYTSPVVVEAQSAEGLR